MHEDPEATRANMSSPAKFVPAQAAGQVSGLDIKVRDVADIGLSVVYEPANEEPIVDIVFVHGLQGHPKRTWYRETAATTVFPNQERINQNSWRKHANAPQRPLTTSQMVANRKHRGIFWPADLLPQDCPKARIVAFGYDSRVTNFFRGAVNQNNVFAHARNLLYALSRLRSNCNERSLIFVAHSLGGIIVKDVLRRSGNDEDPGLHDISNSIKGILFLGTPHRGSQYSYMAETARRILSAVGFDTNDHNLRALNFGSAELEVSHEAFIKHWRDQNFTVRTFHEGRGLKGFKSLRSKVVQDFSSSLDDARQHAQYIDADHRDMCRFTDRNDNGYQQVGGELRLLVENLDLERSKLNVATTERAENTSQHEEDRTDSLSTGERACLKSLCFPKMECRENSIYLGLGQTCEWFFQQLEYESWINVENQIDTKVEGEAEIETDLTGLLWIKGKPGAGKSTLLKTAFQHLNLGNPGPHSAKVAFFFNGLGTRLEKSRLGLFRSILYQLLQQRRRLIPGFLRLYQQKVDMYGPNWEWQRRELEAYFFSIVTKTCDGPLFIIIDALDECEEGSARELITFLEDLVLFSHPSQSQVRICISSRYYPNIFAGRWTEIHMAKYNEPDIRIYLERHLGLDSKIPGFMRLVAEIVRKAAGIFLWVVLVVKRLVKARDEGESLSRLEQIIDEVPDQLNDLIGQLLDSITDEHRPDALRIMQWVLFTSRPLSSMELRYALAFGRDSTFSSQADVMVSATFIETESQMEMLIRSRTKGLVEIKQNPQDDNRREQKIYNSRSLDMVQFIHESVKHVLLHHGGLQILDNSLRSAPLPQSHFYIATTCITCLSISELRNLSNPRIEPRALGAIQAAEAFEELHRKYPFLEYAVKEILHHAKKTKSNLQEYLGLSRSLMIDMQRIFNVWRYLIDLDLRRNFREVHGPYTTFAHLAAEYNMNNWVIALIQQGVDINLPGGRFHTLVQTAAAMGHEELVDTLLEHGADINLSGGRHEHVLTAAAFYGNEKILKSILDRDPDVNALGGEYFTALQAAAASLTGDERIVQLLLDAKADVHICGGRHRNALQAAAFKGNEDVVLLLLNAGARVNDEGGEHGTALGAASFQGFDGIVRILLANSADVHIESGDYGTALWAAAYSGHANVVQILLEHNRLPTGDIVSSEKDSITTPELVNSELLNLMNAADATKRFHNAVARGDTLEIQVLLNDGVDVNARGGDLSSAWHLAAFDGRPNVLKILLAQSNARPGIRDSQGRTPLWYAAAEGHEECVRQLMESSVVDYNVKSSNDRNLLWFPCWIGHVEIVRLLLAKGVDPHEVDIEGVSPLLAAKKRDQLSVVNLLLG